MYEFYAHNRFNVNADISANGKTRRLIVSFALRLTHYLKRIRNTEEKSDGYGGEKENHNQTAAQKAETFRGDYRLIRCLIRNGQRIRRLISSRKNKRRCGIRRLYRLPDYRRRNFRRRDICWFRQRLSLIVSINGCSLAVPGKTFRTGGFRF